MAAFTLKIVEDFFAGGSMTLEDRRLALIIGYLADEPNEAEIVKLIRSFVYGEADK